MSFLPASAALHPESYRHQSTPTEVSSFQVRRHPLLRHARSQSAPGGRLRQTLRQGHECEGREGRSNFSIHHFSLILRPSFTVFYLELPLFHLPFICVSFDAVIHGIPPPHPIYAHALSESSLIFTFYTY